jgi:carbamoyl-phosphate synthase small subunit
MLNGLGKKEKGSLILEDGTTFEGYFFGTPKSTPGEVIFNTGMVGYPETLTDPSYSGQILVCTYPLIGNYGVPPTESASGLSHSFESGTIHIQGLVVCDYSAAYHHWTGHQTLSQWLQNFQIPGLFGIDTRRLTKRIREHGSMLGKIVCPGQDVDLLDPNLENLVSQVSIKEPLVHGEGSKTVVLMDCGAKHNIIRSLMKRGLKVKQVPWNYDFTGEDFDGVMLSNGPGDPKMCQDTLKIIRKLLKGNRPIFGICLGHQLLSLAAGADTYKLKFGHHSQNQPCVEVGTERCYITSQNHGYAVKNEGLPEDWEPWFVNSNDGTNEGIRHQSSPFMSCQFHPEATPGPVDTAFLFDRFYQLL